MRRRRLQLPAHRARPRGASQAHPATADDNRIGVSESIVASLDLTGPNSITQGDGWAVPLRGNRWNSN